MIETEGNKGSAFMYVPLHFLHNIEKRSKRRRISNSVPDFLDLPAVTDLIKGERKAFYPPLEGYRKIIARPKNLILYPTY